MPGVNKIQQEELQRVMEEYPGVFKELEDLPPKRKIEHSIVLDQFAGPVCRASKHEALSLPLPSTKKKLRNKYTTCLIKASSETVPAHFLVQ